MEGWDFWLFGKMKFEAGWNKVKFFNLSWWSSSTGNMNRHYLLARINVNGVQQRNQKGIVCYKKVTAFNCSPTSKTAVFFILVPYTEFYKLISKTYIHQIWSRKQGKVVSDFIFFFLIYFPLSEGLLSFHSSLGRFPKFCCILSNLGMRSG